MDKLIKKEEETHLKLVMSQAVEAKNNLNKSINVIGEDNLDRLKELRENPETGADFYVFLERLNEKNLSFNFKDKYKRLEEFEYILNQPYFSRIDLYDPKTNVTEVFYIGKFGFTLDKPVITDWRTKVASVYYRYRYPQKNISYDTPQGKEVKDLKTKRTFEIENSKLIKYYNNDIQLDESEIISDKISKRTGGVLEDIVETIQLSQLDIIESDPRQICIVQGCVGSGKSTVAIHKLSHIFFNYPTYIRPERTVLIAKNQILVGYLSTLFPKLGIFDVTYKTLRELVYNLIFREEIDKDFDFDLNIDDDTSDITLDKIKIIHTKILHRHEFYKKQIENVFLDDETSIFGGYKYNEDLTVSQNIKDIISDLDEELMMQQDKLKENPDSSKSWLYKENVRIIRKIVKKLRDLRDDLRSKELKTLSKEIGIDLKSKLGYKNTFIYILLFSELVGIEKTQKYEYCVVDEGQDFSPLEYLILSKLVLRGRFAIFGDLNQSIELDGIGSWDNIPAVIKEAKHAIKFSLDTNYRSTQQIINLANNTLSPFTKDYLPKSIFRSGPEPEILSLNSIDDMLDSLNSDISNEVLDLQKSIAVICFRDDIFDKVLIDFTKNRKIKNKLIVLDKSTKVNYVPKGIYLCRADDCKGLEFSKVIILNLNLDKLSDFLSAKKAFVAITRAMNELKIMKVI